MLNYRDFSLLTKEKFDIIERYVLTAPEGNFAEVGVYKGGVAYFLAQHCKIEVHLFDTFEGIPNAVEELDNHRNGDFQDTTFFEVDNLLLSFQNVVFHIGIFPSTAEDLDFEKFSFVHLDGDTYQTTIDGLNFFFPRMVKGGIIIIDDYNWEPCPGVNKAVDEFNDFNEFHQFFEYKGEAIGNQYIIERL